MKFFERQKIDEVGVVGVQLQKILIFLAIVTATGFFHATLVSAVSTSLALLLLYTGFYGAYKRRENCLRFYFVTNVLLIVLAVLAVVLGLAYMSSSDRPSSSPMEMSSTDSMQSAHRSNDGRQHHDGMLGGHHRKQHSGDRQHRFGHHNKPNNDNNAAVSNNNNAQPVAPASDFLPVNPPSQHGNSGGADAENGGAVQPGNGMMDLTPPATNTPSTDIEVTSMSTSMVVGCVIMFLFALIVFAFKIQSIVLAAKMGKMLRATRMQQLAHPVSNKKAPSDVQAPFLANYYDPHNQPAVVYVPMAQYPQQQQPTHPGYLFNPFMVHPAQFHHEQMVNASLPPHSQV